MRILCLGAGGIGGYFGGRLVESGAEVCFIVRAERKLQLQRQGLRIASSLGNFIGAVTALTRGEIDSPSDVVLLTCKAYDLDDAIETIRPAVGNGTAILPLLNGLAHLDRLNDAFGRERVLGGIAKIAVTLAPDGVVRHLNDWRFLTFGEQGGGLSARVLALKAVFDRTTAVATASPDVMRAMWDKAVHLTTVAGMTCLMRGSAGEIARAPGGADLTLRFLDANAAIAAAEGFPPSAAFMAEYRAVLTDASSAYTASMLRDIEAGRQVEADHIIGWMLARAEAHGLDASLHRIAYAHLKTYEQRRAANRLHS